nr:extensin family protein [Actinomycetota bacterium]
MFNIILTPNYNEDHHNHIHVDLTPGADFID